MIAANQLSISEQKDILRLLQRNFPDIAEHELQKEIIAVGQLTEVKAGNIILDHGNYVRGIPLVLDGVIKVSRTNDMGTELFLHYIFPGETCSITLTCCRIDKKSQLKSVAEQDTTLINIPVAYMDRWMHKYPSWKNFVMKSYDQRMNQLIQTIDQVAFERMDTRLIQYLEDKAIAHHSKIVRTTHASIALDLNASREAISRLLKQMEKDGILKLGRNKIELI
jgi:CRP/FNR family transcriptional regulator